MGEELSELDKEEYLPDGSHRCQALTSEGEQCERPSEPDSRYCWQHQPKSEQSQKLTKFTQEKKRQVLKVMEEGKALSIRGAAGEVGVSDNVIYDRVNPDSPRYDPNFATQLEAAKNSTLAHIERWAMKLMAGDWKESDDSRKPDREMIIFMLCNLTSNHPGYVFHKGSKQQILQMQGGNGKSEDGDMSDEEAREQLAEIMGVDPDNLDEGIEKDPYIDAEFEND